MLIFTESKKTIYLPSIDWDAAQVLPGAVGEIDEQEVAGGCVYAEMGQSVCVHEHRRDIQLLLQQSQHHRGVGPL